MAARRGARSRVPAHGLTAYSPEHWTDLFVAAAGASAALAGLVFVAVSINVERILGLAGVPQRALETILLLLGVVVVSIFALVPGQSRTALGVELLGESVASLIAIVLLYRASLRAAGRTDEPRYYLLSHFASAMPGAVRWWWVPRVSSRTAGEGSTGPWPDWCAGQQPLPWRP